VNIVLDTNVIISGFLNPSGAPGQLLYRVTEGEVGLFVDPRILQEYRMVLYREKFDLPKSEVEKFLLFAEERGVWVAGSPLGHSLPDPDDVPFLEVAIGGKADALVTGNMKHYPVAARHGIRLILPSDFMRLFHEK
jgi:putative PIN family toxin of toxin-antitoxin system